MRKILMLLVLLTTACTSSTVIRSSDPDARIYVNGEYIGTGRAYYSDQKVAFSESPDFLSRRMRQSFGVPLHKVVCYEAIGPVGVNDSRTMKRLHRKRLPSN